MPSLAAPSSFHAYQGGFVDPATGKVLVQPRISDSHVRSSRSGYNARFQILQASTSWNARPDHTRVRNERINEITLIVLYAYFNRPRIEVVNKEEEEEEEPEKPNEEDPTN